MKLEDLLHEFKKNQLLYNYITEVTKNAYFGKGHIYNIPVIELIDYDFFDGCCWEASSLLSVFFNDFDIVQRGMLILPKYPVYYHGWIEFLYQNEKYVFDPSLVFLGHKEEYEEKYCPKYVSSIPVAKVRADLRNIILDGENVSHIYKFMPEPSLKKVWIYPNKDINSSFYLTKALICGKVENNKVLSLHAHLY